MSELALALVVHLLLASPEAAEAAARAAASEGREAYDQGDYQRSLARYQQAWELKPAPRLLFNLGQCHRRLGQHAEALALFERYLETNPVQLDLAAATRQLISEETAALAREKAPLKRPPPPRARALEASLKQGAPPPLTSRWWFWTAIGAGVVVVASTGIAVGVATTSSHTTFPDINAR